MLLFIVHLVPTNNYAEWVKSQTWFSMEYLKNNLQHLLLYEFSNKTDKADGLGNSDDTRIVHDFFQAIDRLNTRLKLFLDFTAKAIDPNIISHLKESIEQLVDVSQV